MEENVENSVNAPNRRRNYRPIVFVAVLVLIAGVVAFIIALNNHNDNSNNKTETTTSETEKKEETTEKETEKEPEAKEAEKEEPKKEPEEIEGKTPVSQDGETTATEITGVINYAARNEDAVMIRVSIDQYLEIGTCLLEMVSPSTGDTFSLSDTIAPSAATSSCSYDIAANLLTEGKYNIKITIESDNKKGIIEGEVDV